MAKEKFDFVAPIKDISKALKGFPKNLIRIWKEPVTNSEEVVARRKEIYPMLYLFVAVFAGICLYHPLPDSRLRCRCLWLPTGGAAESRTEICRSGMRSV